jgi:membrane protease subunit (stomatin/prohibitin family)
MADDTTFKTTPTLVIGIGGTGLKVATFVKKSLLEANRNQLPSGMALLVLDTETSIKFQAGGWGRERSAHHATGPVRIDSAGEYLALSDNVKDLGIEIKNEQLTAAGDPRQRAGQRHRQYGGWFQAQYYIEEANVDPAVWNLNVGAGRFRQFGRLALFTHIRAVVDVLTKNLQAIKSMGASQPYVHIAGSLAGGTGAALCADIAHLVKQVARTAGFTMTPVVFGHFVLPMGFFGTPAVGLGDAGTRQDFDARCHAALRELTRLQGASIPVTDGYPMVYDPERPGVYQARLKESPYSVVYLYDGRRANNPVYQREIEQGLAPAIADAIVAYVDDKSGGAFCSHSVNYKSFYQGKNIPAGKVTYGSVGTYTIELPIYHITEGWAHTLAREALDRLLEPLERDTESQVPTKLNPELAGGKLATPKSDAENWLKTATTAVVARLVEWGQIENANQRQRAADAILLSDAKAWVADLAPSDAAWAAPRAEAQTELDASLGDENAPKYFVDYKNQPGQNDEDRAINLQKEVDNKLLAMVGDTRNVWQRAGGNFDRALRRLTQHHLTSFDKALVDWLTLTLNGDPNVGMPVERRRGKLGYARAFLERVEIVLKGSAQVLKLADEQGRVARRANFENLDRERQSAYDVTRTQGGFLGSKRRTYREKSDAVAQFHKADIARKVVYDLVEQLQITVEQALAEVRLWERLLGTAKAAEGGAYALVVDGQKEISGDRAQAENAVRWVIKDAEKGDVYISKKYEQYSEGKLADLLRTVEWKVGRLDGRGTLRIDLNVAGQPWDRLIAETGDRMRGVRCVGRLLDHCRSFYEVAWSDMSVTAYLMANYNERIGELAEQIHSQSGYLLALSGTNEPPMRTTFMRVDQSGDKDTLAFLSNLRSAVAKNFKENTSAEDRAKVQKGADYLHESGEGSRDRFKLTFVMFGDLLDPALFDSHVESRDAYHAISGQGSNWKPLHIFAAETNALAIERQLSTGPGIAQQKRRELSEEVVALLEDSDRFHLAMHCLAYGETDFNWRLAGERGLLLHKYSPSELNGRSFWRLTLQQQGETHGDGGLYTQTGGLAIPESYQLTPAADEPDLLQAFIQLVCIGKDFQTKADIDWENVERTLNYVMRRHHQLWADRLALVPINPRIARDSQLLADAQDRAAQIIRLNALIAKADQELRDDPRQKIKREWAWRPAQNPPPGMSEAERIKVQKFVDLWTAIRGTALQEMENLKKRLTQLATWKSGIPSEEIPLDTGLPTDPVSEEAALADTPHVTVLADDSKGDETVMAIGAWRCEKCRAENLAEDKRCGECGAERPSREPDVAPPKVVETGKREWEQVDVDPREQTKVELPFEMPIPPIKRVQVEVPSAPRVCLNGHPMSEGVKFCPECGAGPKPATPPPAQRVCLNDHPLAEGAKFCPECGAGPKPATPPPAPRVCLNDHPLAEGAKFCPECGAGPKPATPPPAPRVCLNDHPLVEGAKFCPECGAGPKLVAPPPAPRVCLNDHPLAEGAKFCPECGAGPKLVAPPPAPRLCLNDHPLAEGAKFCPECGAGPRSA